MYTSEITILFCIDKRLQNIKGTGITGLAAAVGLCVLWRGAPQEISINLHYSALKKVYLRQVVLEC
jgi:hypothetical protein